MPKIIDPDELVENVEVVINTGAKTITLNPNGVSASSITDGPPGKTSGVTMQALYSMLKIVWISNNTLNKFRFPLKSFTKNEFQWINGWGPANAFTRNTLRDAGWIEGNNDWYAGAISLGAFSAGTDQGYYANVGGTDATTIDFNLTGDINEAVLIDDDSLGVPGEFTTYFKAYLREQGKLYSSYDLLDEQDINALEPTLYRFPLSNSTDLNITASDALIDADTAVTFTDVGDLVNLTAHPFVAGNKVRFTTTGSLPTGISAGVTYFVITPLPNTFQVSTTLGGPAQVFTGAGSNSKVVSWPYSGMSVRYYRGEDFLTATASAYDIGDVVQDGTGRWAYCTVAGTIASPGGAYASFGGGTWVAFEGEKQIGTDYYAFDTVIEGNGGTRKEIYEFTQRALRLLTDINNPDAISMTQVLVQPIVKGNVADELSAYRGSDLILEQGVFIDNYALSEVNNLYFVPHPANGIPAEVNFPFSTIVTLNLPTNVVSEVDLDTRGTLYFTTSVSPGGNDFDTVNAIIVDDDSDPVVSINFDGVDIGHPDWGNTPNAIVFSYGFDTNVQRGNTPEPPAATVPVTLQLCGKAAFETGTTAFNITRIANLAVNIVAADERNYSNPP